MDKIIDERLDSFPFHKKTKEFEGFEINDKDYMLCVLEKKHSPSKVFLSGQDADGFQRDRVMVKKIHPQATHSYKEKDVLVINSRMVPNIPFVILDDVFYYLVPSAWVLGRLNFYSQIKDVTLFNNSRNKNLN